MALTPKTLGEGAHKETSIASAATTDIGALTTLFVLVTGTAPITSLGAGVEKLRFVRFAGVLVLTHNPVSLICPGGVNILTEAGAMGFVSSDASGNWRVRQWTRADGSSLTVPDGDKGDITVSAAGTVWALDADAHLGRIIAAANKVFMN